MRSLWFLFEQPSAAALVPSSSKSLSPNGNERQIQGQTSSMAHTPQSWDNTMAESFMMSNNALLWFCHTLAVYWRCLLVLTLKAPLLSPPRTKHHIRTFFSFSVPFISAGTEVRSYSIFVLIICCVLWCWMCCEQKK